MNRRIFLEFTGMLSAAGMIAASDETGVDEARKPAPDPAGFKPIQQKMGYSDLELKQFLDNPRNLKVLARLKALSRVKVVFEIVNSHGCLVGHQIGEQFIFPSAGGLDTAQSAAKLCPFLMPPMTRMVAIVQERVWEGIDPTPLFYTGQCDDVGLDCNGLGRVVIEVRVEKTAESVLQTQHS